MSTEDCRKLFEPLFLAKNEPVSAGKYFWVTMLEKDITVVGACCFTLCVVRAQLCYGRITGLTEG